MRNKIHTILANNRASHDYSDLFSKEEMVLLHSLTLPENFKIALEGCLTVSEMARKEIRVVGSRAK